MSQQESNNSHESDSSQEGEASCDEECLCEFCSQFRFGCDGCGSVRVIDLHDKIELWEGTYCEDCLPKFYKHLGQELCEAIYGENTQRAVLQKVVKDNQFNFDMRIVYTLLKKHKVEREQMRQVFAHFAKRKAEEEPAEQPPQKKTCLEKK